MAEMVKESNNQIDVFKNELNSLLKEQGYKLALGITITRDDWSDDGFDVQKGPNIVKTYSLKDIQDKKDDPWFSGFDDFEIKDLLSKGVIETINTKEIGNNISRTNELQRTNEETEAGERAILPDPEDLIDALDTVLYDENGSNRYRKGLKLTDDINRTLNSFTNLKINSDVGIGISDKGEIVIIYMEEQDDDDDWSSSYMEKEFKTGYNVSTIREKNIGQLKQLLKKLQKNGYASR